MSSSSITELRTAVSDSVVPLQKAESSVAEPLKGVAFWAAIVLPFLHVPLLIATGLATIATTAAFVVLLALNVIALLVGHPYGIE